MTNQVIKDAIVALQNGNSAEFKDSVISVIHDKVNDAIELRKIYAAQSMFDEVGPNEEI